MFFSKKDSEPNSNIYVDFDNEIFIVSNGKIPDHGNSGNLAKTGKAIAAVYTVGISYAAEKALKSHKLHPGDVSLKFDDLILFELIVDGKSVFRFPGDVSRQKTVENITLRLKTKSTDFPELLVPYIEKKTKVGSSKFNLATEIIVHDIENLNSIKSSIWKKEEERRRKEKEDKERLKREEKQAKAAKSIAENLSKLREMSKHFSGYDIKFYINKRNKNERVKIISSGKTFDDYVDLRSPNGKFAATLLCSYTDEAGEEIETPNTIYFFFDDNLVWKTEEYNDAGECLAYENCARLLDDGKLIVYDYNKLLVFNCFGGVLFEKAVDSTMFALTDEFAAFIYDTKTSERLLVVNFEDCQSFTKKIPDSDGSHLFVDDDGIYVILEKTLYETIEYDDYSEDVPDGVDLVIKAFQPDGNKLALPLNKELEIKRAFNDGNIE